MLKRESDYISVNLLILYPKIQIKIQSRVVCRYSGELIHSSFCFHELIQIGPLLLPNGRGMEFFGGFCRGWLVSVILLCAPDSDKRWRNK